MSKHQDLVGRAAIHPFAFVQDTDPASDPDNHVAAGKAWIDTSTGNSLKVRNLANTAWETVFAGSAAVDFAWGRIDGVVEELLIAPGTGATDWTLVNYI